MSKPLFQRVLMTTDTVGGVWDYSIELSLALAKHGVAVDLVALGRLPSPAQLVEAASVPQMTLHPSEYKLEWMDDPWGDIDIAGRWILDICRELNPDIVHLNNLVFGHLPFGRPTVTVVHSCVSSWWRQTRREDAPTEWNVYRQAVQKGLRGSTAVIAPTQTMLSWSNHFYGPLPQPQQIFNGIGESHKPNTSRKKPFFLTAGRVWDEAKNLRMLAGIVENLPWPTYVAGEGELKTTPNLQPLGQLDSGQLKNWMERAEVYLAPALYEPFGLSILEAATAGAALILSDIPTLRELWDGSAIFADPRHPAAWAEAMQSVAEDEELRRDLQKKAVNRAADYTADRMAKAYLKTYECLINHAQEEGAKA